MGRKVPKGDLPMPGPSENVPGTTMVAFGPGRHDRAAGFSESVGSIVSFWQLSLLVFGSCFWLSFNRTAPHDPKSQDSATNCVWDLRVSAFDNVRIDTPYDGAHDGMGARHLQLVLAIDLLPKRQRPYRVFNVLRRTISTSNGRANRKAALMRSRRRTIDGATSEAARRPVW
jgi:hypothetical protein